MQAGHSLFNQSFNITGAARLWRHKGLWRKEGQADIFLSSSGTLNWKYLIYIADKFTPQFFILL